MTLNIRSVELADLEQVVPLLIEDGRRRHRAEPGLWKIAPDAHARVKADLERALQQKEPPFRQKWLLAETGGRVIGVTHTILLPVPPIYAGVFGPPGLLMESSAVAQEAPAGAAQALLDAAERDLRQAGAQVLLASSIAGGPWEETYHRAEYTPLTNYYGKVGLRRPDVDAPLRLAVSEDVPAIIRLSAENRQILFDLSTFWEPHPEADARFGAWMAKSLTLSDRDMLVSYGRDGVAGYAISQPVTPLHLPVAHGISGIGIIDDYYHEGLADPLRLSESGDEAASLLRAAEAALQARGNAAALVVCPASWASKIDLLERAGYRNAITWFKKSESTSPST